MARNLPLVFGLALAGALMAEHGARIFGGALTSNGSAPTGGSGAAAATAEIAGATPYHDLIVQAAKAHGLDPALLAGVIRQESDFNPHARSGAGAVGLTQLMPGTARSLGVRDPFDPAQSIDGGARYLAQLLDEFGGDVPKALAAYNAGPAAVERYGGVPPFAETQHYVQTVQGFARSFAGAPA